MDLCHCKSCNKRLHVGFRWFQGTPVCFALVSLGSFLGALCPSKLFVRISSLRACHHFPAVKGSSVLVDTVDGRLCALLHGAPVPKTHVSPPPPMRMPRDVLTGSTLDLRRQMLRSYLGVRITPKSTPVTAAHVSTSHI